MRKVNFNDNFLGFEDSEDILLDTNIIYAFLNPYDARHSTVRDLFNNYILVENINLFLYTHSGIVNEVTYLSRDPLRKYAEYYEIAFSEQEVFLLLNSNKDSILKQIDYAMYLEQWIN